jgi:hypothetical protein
MNKPIIIKNGKYKGCKVYGPYTRKRHGVYVSYYCLVNKNKKRTQINEELFEKLNIPIIPEVNDKPFIDWITWNED